MERNLPKRKLSIMFPLTGKLEYPKPKEIIESLEKFEQKCEKSIIETLARLDIKAIVKSDRFSLPYNNEVKVTLGGESYLNGSYEFYRVARIIAKDLLKKDLYKIRFYILVEVSDKGIMGSVDYYFRYHIKQ